MASLEQAEGHSFHLDFTVVGTPVHLALCHYRACGKVQAFTLLVYFVPFLLFPEASSLLPPPPQHSLVIFGCAWLKMTSPPEMFVAEEIVHHVLRTCCLPTGAECCVSDVPSHGPASAGALLSPLGLGVNLGGWQGTVAWVKHSMVTMKSLLKMQILGVTWLNEAREVEALPGVLSLPGLPSGDVGRAAGGRRSLFPAWAAGQMGCLRARLWGTCPGFG